MLVNVQSSPTAAGNTALNILGSLPGVEVDPINYSIALRGKSNVLVQINGRRLYLPVQEVITLLQNTPSSNIDKIEIIASPGANSEAEGGGGILNIVLKKNSREGIAGSFTTSVAYGENLKNTQSVSLNYSSSKLDLFMSAERGANPRHIYAHFKRTAISKRILLDQENNWYQRNIIIPVRIGGELRFAPGWLASSSLSYSFSQLGQRSYN